MVLELIYVRRFWSRVNKHGRMHPIYGRCWDWIGHKTRDGYGHIKIKGRTIRSHRLSLILHNIEIPSGKSVLHHCDNPSCVNPDHLFIGCQLDNMHDMMSKGRHVTMCGELHSNSKLTENDIRIIRSLKYIPNDRTRGINAVARRFKVSRAVIKRILLNQTWKHVK